MAKKKRIKKFLTPEDILAQDNIPLNKLNEEDKDEKKHEEALSSPSIKGEESVSGDMPSPESDDDTLKNAQDVDQQKNEDTDHPKPVDISKDIDSEEESIRTH